MKRLREVLGIIGMTTALALAATVLAVYGYTTGPALPLTLASPSFSIQFVLLSPGKPLLLGAALGIFRSVLGRRIGSWPGLAVFVGLAAALGGVEGYWYASGSIHLSTAAAVVWCTGSWLALFLLTAVVARGSIHRTSVKLST